MGESEARACLRKEAKLTSIHIDGRRPGWEAWRDQCCSVESGDEMQVLPGQALSK